MTLGSNKKISLIIFITLFYSFSFADDKIISSPLINLEKIKPSFEEVESVKENLRSRYGRNYIQGLQVDERYPKNTIRKIIRTVCVLLLVFILFEVAVKFLICILIIGVTSRLLKFIYFFTK